MRKLRSRVGHWLAQFFASALARCVWARPRRLGARRGRPRNGQLRVASLRQHRRRSRLGARSARRHHAGDGQLCRPAYLHLLRRLHGPRRKLHALLLLHVALCRSHARRGHLQQHAPALHVLGTGRTHVLSAHRLLVSKALGSGGREEGVHHHALRRRLLPARHRLALLPDRHAAPLQPRRGIA